MIYIKILICDDEQNYIDDIKSHVSLFMKEHNKKTVFFEYCDGRELLNSNEHFDIAFLDIEINGVNGIDIGKALKNINPHIVIFVVTAYEKYLDEAMDLNVLRFLQKPLNPERLYSGLEKAIATIDHTQVDVLLKDDDKNLVNISVNDIIYIEISGRKTKVITKCKEYFSPNTIDKWRESLIPSFFCSPHKSFIVNIKYVTMVEKGHVILDGKHSVPISTRTKADFQKQFIDYFSHR